MNTINKIPFLSTYSILNNQINKKIRLITIEKLSQFPNLLNNSKLKNKINI